MPTYAYKCPACSADFERVAPFAEARAPQPCECGQQADRVLSAVSFVLKGDDWAGKNIKIRGQMAVKNSVLERKQSEQKRHMASMKLAPNVDGEQVDSWSDARKLATERGKSAASYDALVQREQAGVA
jgi:putative FmdB family regulatory protein